MRIRVHTGYQGAPSRNRWIEPGDYAPKDARLFGLADYLVENGHAIRIADAADATVMEPQVDIEPPPSSEPPVTPRDLQMRKEQPVRPARRRGRGR